MRPAISREVELRVVFYFSLLKMSAFGVRCCPLHLTMPIVNLLLLWSAAFFSLSQTQSTGSWQTIAPTSQLESNRYSPIKVHYQHNLSPPSQIGSQSDSIYMNPSAISHQHYHRYFSSPSMERNDQHYHDQGDKNDHSATQIQSQLENQPSPNQAQGVPAPSVMGRIKQQSNVRGDQAQFTRSPLRYDKHYEEGHYHQLAVEAATAPAPAPAAVGQDASAAIGGLNDNAYPNQGWNQLVHVANYQRDSPLQQQQIKDRSHHDATDRQNQHQQHAQIQQDERYSQQAAIVPVAANSNRKCSKRSLGNVLRSAKDLLTGGLGSIERSASTTGGIVLGSGLLAATIPLVALLLPAGSSSSSSSASSFAPASSSSSSSNGKRNGGFLSSLANGVAAGGLQGRVESMMGWVERSIEHLPNFPRLHPQECVKRSICEAHNEPDKYGTIGFILRVLFPANKVSVTDRMDDMDYKVINKYRHAASFGLAKRLDENGTATGACRDKYEDCLVSLLEVGQSLLDLYLK